MKIFRSRKTNIHRHVLLATFAIASLITSPRAQQPAATTQPSSEDRIALYQALLDLQNPWTVMCVAAHPDDEDGTSLIVMRRKFGAHTVSLFSTFGEGGQNAIGPELYEEMGAIRARETMAAAEIQGSEPHFLGLKDFGFSKTRDEAFKFWGHEEALRRMVLEIRKLRPDVIITNHSVTRNDHGQHQATALMVVEAFDAAADSSKFPEQLKDGVTTWQVQRLFVRAGGNQAANDSATIVTIDPNEKDPVRGVVYAEEALRALQKHATQGPWPRTFAEYANRFRTFSGQTGSSTGPLPMIRYTLVKSAKDAAPMPMQESHNFVDGLTLADESRRRLTPLIMSNPPLMTPDNALALLNDKEVFAKLSGLANGFHQLNQSRLTIPHLVNVREERMDERLNTALALAAGIEVTVTPDTEAVVPGTSSKFVIKIGNHGMTDAKLFSIGLHGSGNGAVRPPETPTVGAGRSIQIVRMFDTPQVQSITVPHAEHLYDGRELGEVFTTTVPFNVQGTYVQIINRIRVDVAPQVEISSISPSPMVIRPVAAEASSATPDTLAAQLSKTSVQLINHTDQSFSGELLYGQDSRKPNTSKIELRAHQNTTIAVSLTNTEKTVAAHARDLASPETLWIAVRAAGSRENITERRVPVVRANARVAPNLRIGFIRGFDFSLPNALAALGVESKELSIDDVNTADLTTFGSVIVDNRVYESRPELITVNQKLLDYANAGGNLIVFYHKSNEWNPDQRRNRPQLAPYKLILGNERITDENAPITFIEPEHPLLNVPNKMGPDDFVGWIQERGLYYPSDWDPQFHALLQSNDPGEQPLKGGLLVADYGRGHYIYTSMVWYRELRGGIPGAYRMLANMISYGAK